MTKTTTQPRPRPQYFSFHQDFALRLCRTEFGTCPFGCAKDGAPNCHVNVTGAEVPGYARRQCEPGKRTQEQADEHADEHAAWQRLQEPQP